MDGLRFGREPPRQDPLFEKRLAKSRKKDVGKPPQFAGLSYLSAALQDRRALLLGYVKNYVVTQDRLALLWTIEIACSDSPSRAPETHPVLAAPALVPASGSDCRAVF